MDDYEQRPNQRRDPDSLAPLQVERTSVEDEAALMSRGKSSQLFGFAAAATLCAVAAVLVIDGMEAQQKRTDAVGALHALQRDRAEAFLHCALPGARSTQIRTGEQLHSAIERTSERLTKGYAQLIARCSPKLDALVSGLEQLAAPDDVAADARALRASAAALRDKWNAYAKYLADDGIAYDYVQALPRVEKIALAWSTYEQRRVALTSALLAAH